MSPLLLVTDYDTTLGMNNTSRIRWAEDQIAEQDKIIADAEAAKSAALAMKADLQAYIRVEQAAERSREDEFAAKPILSALVAAGDAIEVSRRGTKKRAILQILKSLNTPQQTSGIIMQLPLNGVAGATVENTSPQLSAYKADGLVELVSDGWQITQKGRDYLAEKN